MNMDLAIIGNCSFSALVDPDAAIVWACMPRLDSDPRFCALLDTAGAAAEKGVWAVDLLDQVRSEQHYRRNSAVLVTRKWDRQGAGIEITDFAPRYKHFGRTYRPTTIIRTIRPLSGSPRICVRLRPVYDSGAHRPDITRGCNHARFVMPDMVLRMTTDGPLGYVLDEVPFILHKPMSMILGPDESLQSAVDATAQDFLARTDEYWREWCRYLVLPFEWQDAVIRAAISLKLSNYEESGAIVAAMTTSIPEHAHSGRNWDYRFCWLRDSFFVVKALNELGATKTMEGYLDYISNIVAGSRDGYLQPVYGITLEDQLLESSAPSLAGYRGMGPVRIGNDAWRQVQNDGYGSVILSSAQSFFDQRLARPGDVALFERLERLGRQALARWNEPDAGLWELRTRQTIHTYSAMLCWAACDRLARIARRLGLDDRAASWGDCAALIHKGIIDGAWNEKKGGFTAGFGNDDADASLLLMPQLGFLPAEDPRYLGTLALCERELLHGDHMYRYVNADDFGVPETAFNVCTFWYIEALAATGRKAEARRLFESMLSIRNSHGYLSEDVDPKTGELWGNFPQTYSMVGLIHCAKALSAPWSSAF